MRNAFFGSKELWSAVFEGAGTEVRKRYPCDFQNSTKAVPNWGGIFEGSDFETKMFGKRTAVEVTSNMDKLISSTTFIGEYLKNIPAEFEWQKSPIQIYPLSFLKNHFDLPLPVLRADYNFIFFIREGHFEQRLGTKRHRAEADSIVFVSTETVSALENISEDVKGYFVLIEDESMAKLLIRMNF